MRLTKEEIDKRLQELQDQMANESFGKNYAAYYDLAEEAAMLTFALREGRYRLPIPAPKPVYCARPKCAKVARTLEIYDDRDSNVVFWQIEGYCSLECYVCHLKQAFGRMKHDDGGSLFQMLRRIK